jgi:hypothetical protein
MILDLEVKFQEDSENKPLESEYNPTDEEKEVLEKILFDFNTGKEIMDQSYREFNNRTLSQYLNDSQRAFNSFVPDPSGNPDDDWKANTVRPVTRNRIISIAAHVTSSILAPSIFAQNDNDEEDKAAAQVMADLVNWAGERSDYSKTFVYSVIAACVNPAVIIHSEYRNVYKTIKEINADGTWTSKEVLDEDNSGFQDQLVPVDEIYIGDIYENNIQKQPFLLWRRVIDYTTAQAKYKDKENFKYVNPGIQNLFVREYDAFYQQYDEELQGRLVEELIYWNKSTDSELHIVNGVLLDDPNQPMMRKDKKYPFTKGGYELIDEGRFFYYKSLADKMKDDQRVIDTLYNMIIDGTYLQLMPPVVVFGSDDYDSSIIEPGSVTTFSDPNTKINPVGPTGNLGAGFNTLDRVEASLSESSNDTLQSGQAAKGEQTAYEISRLEQNARTVLGLFGRMVGFMVKDFGDLRINDIVQHLTVGDVSEITGPTARLKFRKFLVENDSPTGEKITKRIELNNDQVADPMEESFKLLESESNLERTSLVRVNPEIFSRLKFMVKVSPDFKPEESSTLKKALNLEAYDRAIANPHANQKEIFRDFLLGSYEISKENPDKYIQDSSPADQAGLGGGQTKQPNQQLIRNITGQGVGASSKLAQ